MKTIKCFFLSVFLGVASAAFAQLEWQEQAGPYGGAITDVVIHPTTFTLYTLTGRSIFRSSNNGANWIRQKPAAFGQDLNRGINDLEMLPDGTLLALSEDNLYKSIDDGNVWTKVNSSSGGANGFSQAFSITRNVLSQTLYVMGVKSGNYTVFRSVNNGLTWTTGFQSRFFVQFATTATGDVYAISNSVGGSLWKSTDDGVNFAALPSPFDAGSAYSLTSTPTGTKLYFSAGTSNMFSLASPFTTWVQLAETGISPAGDQNTYGSNSVLKLSPDNNTLFLIDNTNNKFYSSPTAAISWTQKSIAFVNAGGDNGIAMAIKDASNLYVITEDNGLWKSVSGGTGWTESDAGITGVSGISMAVADDNSIIISGQRTYRSAGPTSGSGWTVVNVPDSYYSIVKSPIGSPRPIFMFAGGGASAFKSINNGVSWTALATTPSSAFNFATADGTKFVGYGNQIFYSSNAGTSWSAALNISGLPSSFSIRKVILDQNAVMYVYLDDNVAFTPKLYKVALTPNTTSPTGGTATGIPLTGLGMTGLNEMRYLNNKIYVLGYTNSEDLLSISSNAGVSWTTKPRPVASQFDVDPLNNYLFLSANSNETFFINLSRDDGDTYVSSSPDASTNQSSIVGVAVDPTGIAYASFGYASVYKSTHTVVTPVAPSGLVSSGATSDRITLRWIDNATNETDYIIEKFNGTSYVNLDTISNGFNPLQKKYYEVRNLTPGTSYQFRVAAINLAGSSSYVSVTASTTALCASALPDNKSWNGTINATAVTNVSIKALGNGIYSISELSAGTVTANPNIPGKFIESCNATYLMPSYPLWTNGTGTWTSGTNTLVLKFITDGSLTPETTGTVTLVKNAVDPIPAAPSTTSAYVYGNNTIEISWVGSAFETQYLVERSTDNFATAPSLTLTVDYPATSVVDNTSLVLNTTYYYRVKAKNANGTSAASNTANVNLTKPYFTLANSMVGTTTSVTTIGAIWGDFDNDGFDDLVMPQLTFLSRTPSLPMMFRNNGAGDFTLVTAASGMDQSMYLVGTAADYDNDGNLDLFLTSASEQNFLYKGHGNFTFTKVAATPVSENLPFSTEAFDLTASWADYNKDGLVDLYVVPQGDNVPAKFFTQGPAGVFTKETAGTLATLVVQGGVTLWADYDNDGDQDVFITDGTNASPNQLYRNNGDNSFTRVTGAPFDTDLDQGSFGAAWGDYNNDGFLDLFITADNSNLLYKNNGNGTFTKQSMPATITETKSANADSNGAAWGDVNNDGFIDLVVANNGGETQFYINNNGTSFTKIKNEKVNDIKIGHFGLGFSDYNNDGFIDLAMAVVDQQFQSGGLPAGLKNQLFKNNTATGNWIEFKLKGIASNRSAIGTRVTLVAGGKTQIREVASTATLSSQNSQVLHFGLGSNTTITSVQIKWPSGKVQNMANITAVNLIRAIDEDDAAPAVTLLNPTANATKVAVNTPVEITFNELATPIAGKKINVFLHGSGSPLFSLNATDGIASGNKLTYTLPSALDFLTVYDVVAEAGSFTDQYGNATAVLTWSFTSLDNQVPTLAFTQVPALDKGFGTSVFTVVANDNNSVSAVTMNYRSISTKTTTALSGVHGTGNNWTFDVQESFFDNSGIQFYFTATDPDGNIGRLPTGTGMLSTLLKFEGPSSPTMTLLKGSGAVSGYQIVSVPFELSTFDIATNFEEFGSKDVTKYRFLHYHEKPTPGWDEYPGTLTSLKRGDGYFINTTDVTSIKLVNARAPKENRDTLFVMNLKQGWNQIGNPYAEPIQWTDVLAYNSNPAAVHSLVTFSAGDYHPAANPGTIDPKKGGFVQSDADIALQIPFKGQTSGGRLSQPLISQELGQENWIVDLVLKQNDAANYMTGFGMASDARTGGDRYDMGSPPRFNNFIEMTVAHPDHFMKRFARDVVSSQPDYAWSFDVDCNQEGVAEMSWDNGSFGVGTKELYLFDVVLQKPVDMRTSDRYTFNPKESTHFKIYYGEQLDKKIHPDRVMLGKAFPNPSSGITTIPFTLPENPALFRVSLEVFDLLGNKVATLAEGDLAPGFYSSDWNPGLSNASDGLYVVRMVVANGNKSTVHTNKVVLSK